MAREPIQRLKVSRKTRRLRQERQEVLPIDPRDPEVVRAKVARKRG